MARNVTELSVFVASPSDVEEEVTRLDDVIDRLNLEWDSRGIRLKLVRWRTHAGPGFGEDPQTVINDQIQPDHDVFIAILWSRIGTPTPRAESGTIEEFQRAKERYDEDPDSIALMLYFKMAPVPQPIDAKQIQAVQDFQSGLGDEGGLYWTFETADDFERTVRLHLALYLQKKTSGSTAIGLSVPVVPEEVVVEEAVPTDTPQSASEDEAGTEEPGLLDLQDEFDTEFAEVGKATKEIVAALTEVGDMMQRRTADLERAKGQPNFEAVKRRVLRNVSDNAAAGLDKYVAKTEAVLPRFTTHLDRGISVFARMLPVQAQISKGTVADQKSLKEAVSSLRDSFRTSAEGLDKFRGNVDDTPGMTKAMNRARRAAAQVIQRQIDAIRRADLQLAEVESLTENWITDEDEETTGQDG